ncbi:MAG: H-NS family nucleoid-associated regulatory protein [Hyphomicrobiaceae bacterium]
MARLPHVDQLSLVELVELEARLKRAIFLSRERECAALRARFSDMARKEGFSLDEIFGRVRAGKSKSKSKGKNKGNRRSGGKSERFSVLPAKYINPANVAETWTGRGRKPRWLVKLMDEGAKIDEFLL